MKIKLTEQEYIRMLELAGLKEQDSINEIFGFSKEEKERKALEQDVAKANQEIDKMDISALWRQTQANTTNSDYMQLANIIRYNIKERMPTFAKLFPEVLTVGKGTGVASARYNHKGNILHGITLSPLSWMLTQSNTDNIDQDASRERLKKLVNEKLKKQ